MREEKEDGRGEREKDNGKSEGVEKETGWDKNALLHVHLTKPAVSISQAAQKCQPCVNGDTSFQWEVL